MGVVLPYPMYLKKDHFSCLMPHAWHHVQALGSHGAAALRPQLARAAKQGHAAVKRAALSGAAQQKLILCSAILQEVRQCSSAGHQIYLHCFRSDMHIMLWSTLMLVTYSLVLTLAYLASQVALTFGFRLKISNAYGVDAAPTDALAGSQAAAGMVPATNEQPSDAPPPLQNLSAAIFADGDELDGGDDEEEDTSPPVRRSPRGAVAAVCAADCWIR